MEQQPLSLTASRETVQHDLLSVDGPLVPFGQLAGDQALLARVERRPNAGRGRATRIEGPRHQSVEFVLFKRNLRQPVHMRLERGHVAGQSLVALPLRPNSVFGELRQMVVGMAITYRQNPDRIDIGLK